jgi:uncharacterized RmlC-like cupin family protein
MTTSATERVRVIQPGQTYVGKQGFRYGAGASAETVGAGRANAVLTIQRLIRLSCLF